MAQLGKEPILLAFTFLTLLFGMIYMQGIVTLPLDMQNHGLGPSDYGLASAANGILIVLVTIQLSRLIARWPPFAAMALSALALGAGFGMNVWASTLPAYVIAVIVWTVGEIIGAAVAPTIIANLAPVERRGLYQGVFGSAWGLSFFIGPIVGTWVFDQFSPDVLWIGCGSTGCGAGRRVSVALEGRPPQAGRGRANVNQPSLMAAVAPTAPGLCDNWHS